MAVYVALLRAVNVGGTGTLAMSDLQALCERIGFRSVRTVLQSGNVVFSSPGTEGKVQELLSEALARRMKAPVGVLLRTPAELQAVLDRNPFPKAPTNKVIVFFMPDAPAKGALDGLTIPGKEEVRLVGREIFVHYPDGQGKSKLRLPQAKIGTGRNLNTVSRLVELADASNR
jgi:uncharacterized protein (DUF1697 family)